VTLHRASWEHGSWFTAALALTPIRATDGALLLFKL